MIDKRLPNMTLYSYEVRNDDGSGVWYFGNFLSKDAFVRCVHGKLLKVSEADISRYASHGNEEQKYEAGYTSNHLFVEEVITNQRRLAEMDGEYMAFLKLAFTMIAFFGFVFVAKYMLRLF
jgi:hypothetical protein